MMFFFLKKKGILTDTNLNLPSSTYVKLLGEEEIRKKKNQKQKEAAHYLIDPVPETTSPGPMLALKI